VRKKLTYEFVRDKFEKENYTLLSEEYIGNKAKLAYRCNKGHEHSIVWSDWQQGYRCSYCARRAKPLLEQVIKAFEEEGYILLSEEYINSKTKLYYICPNGHKHSIRWFSWQGGISCEPYCIDWTKEYKEYIRIRDGNKCLNPTCSSNSRLTIHHIDYNKKNCGPDNLITICNSCNIKANTDREWHMFWYRALLFRRYNYTY
jgi:hypothetical protein